MLSTAAVKVKGTSSLLGGLCYFMLYLSLLVEKLTANSAMITSSATSSQNYNSRNSVSACLKCASTIDLCF
jgi:hypothetical protein